ncbi:MAG: sensor histidine kinase, partial [Polyangiaceae bacterium]
ELLKKRVDDEVALEFVREIFVECLKVSGIVRALLSLARKDDKQVGEVSVREVVDDIVRLARHALSVEGIHVEIDLPRDVPELCEGAQQLRQVMMNLVTNACDALRIREATRRDDKRLRIVVTTRSDAGMPWLVVDTIDNADGIEAALVDRIFDPFFTTKPPGRGTGLGLAISQELVSGCGGRLTCQTARGKGSSFRVELPLGASKGPASAARHRRFVDERKTAAPSID